MKLDSIHHIAIIGHDYAKTKDFYVDKLGFDKMCIRDSHYIDSTPNSVNRKNKTYYLKPTGNSFAIYNIEVSES